MGAVKSKQLDTAGDFSKEGDRRGEVKSEHLDTDGDGGRREEVKFEHLGTFTDVGKRADVGIIN